MLCLYDQCNEVFNANAVTAALAQAAEVKRMMEYADSRVEHLAAKYEVSLCGGLSRFL